MLVEASAPSNRSTIACPVNIGRFAAIMPWGKFEPNTIVLKAILTPEIVAAALGLVNVGLLVRRSIWNYAFGIASVALYGYVFYTARLYSDAILQIYFFTMQFYGWWNWFHGRNQDGLARIETMTSRERFLFGAGTLT